MVLCKYFVQGRCYYGDSCRNEHSYDNSRRYYAPQQQPQQQIQSPSRSFNEIKQIVAEEIRQTEGGNQWLLSCFSPLKEDLVPGLDDISPEEIRYEAYEAQKRNTFDIHKKLLERLKQLYQAKRNELANMDYNYFQALFFKNKPSDATSSEPGTPTSSIFGNTAAQTSAFQSGNIFGGSTTAPTQQTPASNFSFNLLGDGNSQQGKSIFGGSSTFGQAAQSTFGQPASPQPSSTFGQPAPIATVFGQPSVSSIFGQAPSTPVFGAAATSSTTPTFSGQSVFGQTPSTNVFGQTQNVFGQPQTPQQSQNIFGQTTPTQEQPPTNIFGQAAAPFGVQAQSTSVFGGQNQANQPTTTFTSQSQSPAPIFGQSPTTNVFNPATQAQTNVFNAATQAQTNVFNTAPPSYTQSTSAFSQSPQTTSPFSQPTNVFAQTASTFSQNQNVFSQPANQSPFQQQSPFSTPTKSEASVSNVNPFTQAPQPAAVALANPYSKLEELSEEDKKAFQATEFVLGKIPTKPPTREMCAQSG